MFGIFIIILIACLFIYFIFKPYTSYEFFQDVQNNPSIKKGAILMYCTQNIIDNWAHYSIFINQKYANKQGYDFILIKNPYDSTCTHAWQKIPAMLNLLNQDYRFVMYIDADAIINIHNISVETILDKYKGDVIVCSDKGNSNGKYAVNGGMVIVRNTENSRKLLNKWWELRHKYNEFAYEQWALSDLVRNKYPDIDGSIISIAPETEFNSLYSEILQYLNDFANNPETIPPNRFVLHFMSTTDETRKNILAKLYSRFS